MKTTCYLLVALFLLGWAACQVHIPVVSDYVDPDTHGWRRTADGWERNDWTSEKGFANLPHPLLLAAGIGLLALFALIAFSPVEPIPVTVQEPQGEIAPPPEYRSSALASLPLVSAAYFTHVEEAPPSRSSRVKRNFANSLKRLSRK